MPSAGEIIYSADHADLPDEVSASGASVNTLAGGAATWTNLPTNNISAVITNPSSTRDLLVQVSYGAWLDTSAGDVRFCIACSGGLTIGDGIGVGGALSWGEIPSVAGTVATQCFATYTAVILAGAAACTFRARGYRSSGAATAHVNYPTLRVTPIRWQRP